MGYTTAFNGEIAIDPPLSEKETDFLHIFSNTRRMLRKNGPYFVGGTGLLGQGDDKDVIGHNIPPLGQPGLWCQWVPNNTFGSNEGTALEWDSGEKFYMGDAWMLYLIQHFLAGGALAIPEVPGLQGNHVLNGTIHAQGDDEGDIWDLIVEDNKVFTQERGGPKLRIEPTPYDFDLTYDPKIRNYFESLFRIKPRESWTLAQIECDLETGAPSDILRAYVREEVVATFRIEQNNKLTPLGTLEWMPEE